ncbi:MAG: hypothetical protein M3Q76_08375, partial [Acidobacteriota bacterium]|nr:hypothetical protein [Acidobacteriota bacterium]
MSPITKSSFAKVGRGLWFGALAVALVVAAQIAAQRGAQVEEYPHGCDSFGYLRMAQEIRQAAGRGELPRFNLESEHTRLLIDLMRSRDVSPNLWDEMIAPHAHHYFPRANHVGVQYPPGTGLLLALFPPDKAVRGLNRAIVLVFLAMGLLLLALAAAARAWVSAGFVVLALYLGLDILGNMRSISFSINAVLLPLLLSFVCMFAALRAGEREGAEGNGGGLLTSARLYALASGIFMGLAVLIRLPVVFLLPGLLVLWWSPAWRAFFKSTLFAFGLGVLLCGIVPLLVHQHRLAGAWYL